MSNQLETTAQRQQAIATLRELIKNIHVAMLTTSTADGDLRSRPMVTARHEFDGSLWFFTLDGDPKVAEIKRQHAVNVAYSNPDSDCYVSISGTAELVRDKKKAELLWSDELREWFPAGPADPDLALLRVDVQEAEYWDSKINRLTSGVKGLIFRTGKKRKHEKIDWADTVEQSS